MKKLLVWVAVALLLTAVGGFTVGYVTGVLKRSSALPVVTEVGVYGVVINKLPVGGRKVWL
jgi:hypothetical protein